MAKKRHYEDMMKPASHARYEVPADKRKGMLLSEDFSRPCGLPYGAIQRDCEQHPTMGTVGMVGDLYWEVKKTMEEDAANLRSLTKPTNW